MTSYGLENCTIDELRKMAREMELPSRRSKSDAIADITKAFKEYEKYKSSKIDRYKRLNVIGKGKEGTTYSVTDRKGNEYAMKTFRKKKSSNTLLAEYDLQKRAAMMGIAPKVYNHDIVSKYIVMQKMDGHLLDIMIKQKGHLTKNQQHRIIEIFQKLDEAKVFHGDANLMNYMIYNKQIYIIDFGFAKPIDSQLVKKLRTNRPNSTIMLLGFILKLKEKNCPPSAYRYLSSQLSEEDSKLLE